MRRSPADSTNRSLAAFGKLQHIRQERAGTLTHCGAGAACGYPGLHPSPPTPAGDEYDDQADDSLRARRGRAANVPSTDVDPGG